MIAPIRYARSGDVNIAYQVTGSGAFDLVLVSGFVSHLEADWDHPMHARFLERLGSFARLIRFDKRGTGLSDRAVGLPDFETRMDDVRAVMDAADSAEAALFGYSEGGPMSVLFAATYPERTRSLVLYGTYARRLRAEDYPWAPTWDERKRVALELERDWGDKVDLSTMIPNADPAMAEWFQRRARAAASPAAARDLILMNSKADVRAALNLVQCPTLVLHRTGDLDSRVEEGRFLAEHIPGARYLELDGPDHVPWVRMEEILNPLEEFLTGTRRTVVADRVLTTILFTDLVRSTDRVRELGDAAWASLLLRHDEAVRAALKSYGGEEVDKAGDGFLALFTGPARAIRCAVEIRRSLQALGLDVRAGVHTGEVERVNSGRPSGIAVHLAARVVATARPGDVLVTQTTRDLVEGSGLSFEDRGVFPLKGIEGERRLYAATT